jgi:hypothetical protein
MPQSGTNSARPTSLINARLNQALTTYVAAASAAGVALLAANPSAEAKVVYTPAHTYINGNTAIDLNHDGIADFMLGFHELDKSLILAVNPEVSGNEILAKGGAAVAGIFGQPVGPGAKFAATASSYGWLFMADAGSYSQTWFFGNWANTKNRYLGFKFLINGQVHYGWARLSVADYLHSDTAVILTGYAYETEANTKIIDGETSGTADNMAPSDLRAPAQAMPTLGMLARGADTLSIWRRNEEPVLR